MSRDRPRRVFLHVGSPKTGTTFLQQVLWRQKALAMRQGLLLPLGGFNDHYLGAMALRGMAHKTPDPERTAGAWQQLAKRAGEFEGSSLISHELLAGLNKAQARRAVEAFPDGLEVHVVLTARDLVRQLTAEWQEHIKHRATAPLSEFIAGVRADESTRKTWFWRVQDYAWILSRWAQVVPADRIHVVTVPAPGGPPSLLWERFAGLVGLNPADFDLSSSRSNTSLGIEQVEVLRRVNERLRGRLSDYGEYPRVVKEVLAHRVLAGLPGTKLELIEADAAWAASKSAAQADRLGAAGYDIVGDLADLRIAIDASSAAGYPTPDAARLLDEAVAAIAALMEEMNTMVEARRDAEDALRAIDEHPVRGTLVRASRHRPRLAGALGAYRRLRHRGAP